MLIGSYDITFCHIKECKREECRRHYVHTLDIPREVPVYMFAEDPRGGKDEKDCPYYWKWYKKEVEDEDK